jgi:hypothetical protein
MKDTQKILRQAVYDIINGQLSYNGSNVPVYDEKRKVGQADSLFVILGTQQETDDSTSDAFITDSSIDIEIQHRTEFEVSKDAIDDVSNQILQILMPTPQTDGFLVQNLFQITCVRRTSTISRNFSISDSVSIIAKIITISAKIVQQA